MIDRWDQALEYGTVLADRVFDLSQSESWDNRATAGVTAMATFALAQRHEVVPHAVGLDRLICPLMHHTRYMGLVHSTLPDNHLFGGRESDDPVAAMWAWLTRRWPTDVLRFPVGTGVEYPPRYSIAGRCTPRPATEIYLLWAANAVDQALRAERGALSHEVRSVHVTGGPHTGRTGRLENPVWQITADLQRVVPGPPSAYVVTLEDLSTGQPEPIGSRIKEVPADYLAPM
ncbi:hypothetical protein KBO27_04010 [Saccharopolyspora endophytica]|uniref:Uncharacterized protein n=1 Tax=Saccharopolyspora endophytica TaxID=543886 RepID=A0ABS5D9X8_9PSEU|nr:hypothetical protein [Saccharopolyspora endophytica]